MDPVPNRLFCFGMPKCGTTTVAALLDAHPAISMHSQKEPGDFLREPAAIRLSGYTVTAATRWLADFTTTYGLRDNRDTFFGALRTVGIAPQQARFILCLRDPSELARSYMRHIVERRNNLDLAAQTEVVRADILSACDFEGAVNRLEREAGREAVFVVRFDDLLGDGAQRRLAAALYGWLDLPPHNDIAPIWANRGGSVRRYPAGLAWIAGNLRHTDFVRSLSPQWRARIRRVFARAPARHLPAVLVNETLAWLEMQEPFRQSRAVLAQVATGPLAAGREVVR